MREPTVVAIDWSGAKGEGRHAGHLDHRDARWRSRASTGALGRGARRSTSCSRNRLPSLPGSTSRSASRPGSRRSSVARRSTTCGGAPRPNATPGSRRRRRSGTPDATSRQRSGSARARHGCAPAGYPAKSVFQLVGNGQVGRGSVRGMPHLARLRAEGFAIWPFDGASDRLVVEIYPSLLRRRFPHLDDGAAPDERRA